MIGMEIRDKVIHSSDICVSDLSSRVSKSCALLVNLYGISKLGIGILIALEMIRATLDFMKPGSGIRGQLQLIFPVWNSKLQANLAVALALRRDCQNTCGQVQAVISHHTGHHLGLEQACLSIKAAGMKSGCLEFCV